MAIGPHLSFPHADLFRLRKRIFNLTKVSPPPAGGTAGKSCGRHAFRAGCVHVRASVCAHVRPYARAGARVCAWVAGRVRHTCVFVLLRMCFAEPRKVSLPRARCRVCVRVVASVPPCAAAWRRACANVPFSRTSGSISRMKGEAFVTVAAGEAITDADDEGCPDQLVSPGTDERTLKTRERCSGALFLNAARALTARAPRLTDSHCLYHATIGK